MSSRPDRTTHTSPNVGIRATTVAAALLAVAVAVIHVLDQGGVTELKDPTYLGIGYWLLELAGLVCAVALFTSARYAGWVLALGVAGGPLLGIIISRSVGLPDATDDIGNWGEPLGVLAMIVEAVLLVLAVTALTQRRRVTSGAH